MRATLPSPPSGTLLRAWDLRRAGRLARWMIFQETGRDGIRARCSPLTQLKQDALECDAPEDSDATPRCPPHARPRRRGSSRGRTTAGSRRCERPAAGRRFRGGNARLTLDLRAVHRAPGPLHLWRPVGRDARGPQVLLPGDRRGAGVGDVETRPPLVGWRGASLRAARPVALDDPRRQVRRRHDDGRGPTRASTARGSRCRAANACWVSCRSGSGSWPGATTSAGSCCGAKGVRDPCR